MSTRKRILEDLASGKISVEDAEEALKHSGLLHIEDVANIDLHREHRAGIPEVILGSTKAKDELLIITQELVEKKGVALLTRVSQSAVSFLESKLKDVEVNVTGRGDHLTVLVSTETWTPPKKKGRIAVLTAGTSDIPYAREVEGIANLMGVEVMSFFDVGVAGIHRLINPLKEVLEKDVDALVVLAGMEGALPTIVASLVDVPVIGVPIPTGYGHGGDGETALASMLQSCSPGLTVVNIGNGIGAGSFAALIARRRQD
jgi:NCAIR mutase (PurE)-related protein